ncbi:MAG: 30S ribosomal protein S19e [Candidatus Nanoarchaeia archaeon]
MKNILSKKPDEFIDKLAGELKKLEEFKAPEWMLYVKTSSGKVRPPQDDDFWYKRAASILRQLYINAGIGVGKLRKRYGTRIKRGVRPDEFRKGSGNIIRKILQQAEAAGLVEKQEKGRALTDKGRSMLDNIETGGNE